VRRQRWTRSRRPSIACALRNGWLDYAGRGQFETSRAVEALLASRLEQLWLWRRDLADLVAITESSLAPFGWVEECDREAVSADEEAPGEQPNLCEFQRFSINPESVRIVADDRLYTISGSVTGPAAAHARIRIWLGDPATGYKRRDPILGTETLVSGNLIVDLPEGYNSFSFVLDSFQLPANIPQPPSSADPWVLTASATGGEAESDPVLLPPPEYACPPIANLTEVAIDPANFESVEPVAPQPPVITVPPPGGVTVRNDTTYEIKGVQPCSPFPLLIEAWPDGEEVVAAQPFATVLSPGDTSFSLLVKLRVEGPNLFVVRVTDLTSGFESPPVIVPRIARKQNPQMEELRAISGDARFP
jgi:hypothetical protein